MLPCYSKIFEKCVAYQITNYLNANSLFYSNQFGFRKGHSTIHPLLKFLQYISNEKNKDNNVLAIFIDLKKAFDTVNHCILLEKFKYYGITGKANAWFRSYLLNRQQFVSINSTNSNLATINIGVPQGSVLGPLLFLLFINDMPSNIDFFTILFADDTTLQLSDKSLDNLISRANFHLKSANDWFNSNRLTLNIKKTKCMLFTPNNTSPPFSKPLKIDNINIERIGLRFPTRSFKLVGIKLDDMLKWGEHANGVRSKLASTSYAIARLKKTVPRDIKLQMFNSLFKCHTDYCLPIWGNCPASNKKSILNLQKKTIRNINSSKYNAHTDPIFKKLKILKFEDSYTFATSLLMFQVALGTHPSTILDLFNKSANFDRNLEFILTRNDKYHLKSIPNSLILIWNNLAMAF